MRAVIFDFDGLILDSETPSFTSWCAAFEGHGCPPLSVEEWGAEIGTVGGLDLLALLRARAPVEMDADAIDVDALQIARRAHRDQLLALETVRPGVVEWIAEARLLRMACAIASSSEVEWVDAHLERLGLRQEFLHLACFGPTLRAKPHPDTYLDACAAVGVAPREAIAVEDSPHGISAARAAGLHVVAVPNDVTVHLDLSAADLQLPSLAATTLGEAITHLSASL